MKKIILLVEERVADDAKRIAREQGTCVSSLFARWVRSLAGTKQAKTKIPANSITARATGIARLPEGQSEKDIVVDALVEKYGPQR